ncbi:MAG: DUF1351 domain-containing protein [Oscillospiraceae bacterium]|nr:DUF1351 domain-containing protein [Oscillospiraceae bacterium]
MEEKLVKVESAEWITVAQLPVIEDKLAELHAQLQDQLAVVKSLAPTDENYKEMKKIRADWNKRIDMLEALRKRVKAQIEAPYKSFESGPYKSLVSEMKDAVGQLDGGIKEVEGNLKVSRQKELLAYYEEYRQSLGLDKALADPRRSGISVGLSGSMKGLKEQAKAFLDRIDGDLKMIDTLDNADEVLAEYRILLSVTDAVRVVADRHKRIEEERKRREAEEEVRKEREAREAAVAAAIVEDEKENALVVESVSAPLAAPVAEPVQEDEQEKYSTVFRVYGTLDMLRALKAFLVDGGYEFENVKGE